MRLEQLIIGATVFIAFIALGVGILYGTTSNPGVLEEYNVSSDSTMYDGFSKDVNQMYNISDEMENKVMNLDSSEVNGWEALTIGVFSALRIIPQTFNIIGNSVQAIAQQFGIPSIFISFVMIATLSVVLFTIIYLVMRVFPPKY